MQTDDEILCRTKLTAWQMMALVMPTRSYVWFGIVMLVIWGALVPFTSIAKIVLLGAVSLAALKLSIALIAMTAYKWRVLIDGKHVSFFQGTNLVASCNMVPEDTNNVELIDSRWLPSHIKICKTNGETLETLYGVAPSDLRIVLAHMHKMLYSSRQT